MSERYHDGSRELQDRFDTRRLADRLEERVMREVIRPEDQEFIERMDMFFLATADAAGQPQCSYKGGDPGFVRVLDERTLAFPNYDGNGMYLSLGNVLVNPNVGLLLIDFLAERPSRMRVEGTATIAENDQLMWDYPGAQFVVRVQVQRVFLELPALHPPHGARRALAVRPADRRHAAGAGVEARRSRRGGTGRGGPRRRTLRDVASGPWRPSPRSPSRSRPPHPRSAASPRRCTAGR